MNPDLVGLWTFQTEPTAPEGIILQVFPDGRVAQFYKQHPSLTRRVAMTLHATPECGDTYRARTTADAPGYLVTLRRAGPNLVTELNGRITVAHPLATAENPAWHAETLARAVWR
jgi:hypothetical protein